MGISDIIEVILRIFRQSTEASKVTTSQPTIDLLHVITHEDLQPPTDGGR